MNYLMGTLIKRALESERAGQENPSQEKMMTEAECTCTADFEDGRGFQA